MPFCHFLEQNDSFFKKNNHCTILKFVVLFVNANNVQYNKYVWLMSPSKIRPTKSTKLSFKLVRHLRNRANLEKMLYEALFTNPLLPQTISDIHSSQQSSLPLL